MRENIRKEREGRVPLSDRDILTVKGLNDRDEYVYRWVNDTDDRVERLYRAGYEFVDRFGKIVGDATYESCRGNGSIMSKDVGMGMKAYLMKQPRDIWLADRKKRVDEPTDASVETIKQKANAAGLTGKIEIT